MTNELIQTNSSLDVPRFTRDERRQLAHAARALLRLAPLMLWTMPDLAQALVLIESMADALDDVDTERSTGEIPPQMDAETAYAHGAEAIVGELHLTWRQVRIPSVHETGNLRMRENPPQISVERQTDMAARLNPASNAQLNVPSMTKKRRKKRIANARERADKFLLEHEDARYQFSGEQLAKKLGISKTVACEALAVWREKRTT